MVKKIKKMRKNTVKILTDLTELLEKRIKYLEHWMDGWRVGPDNDEKYDIGEIRGLTYAIEKIGRILEDEEEK